MLPRPHRPVGHVPGVCPRHPARSPGLAARGPRAADCGFVSTHDASGGYGEFFARGDRQSDQVIGRVNFVASGYLEALGARLVAGRWLEDTDNRADGPRVAIIGEQTRRMFYPGQNPVGQTMVIRGERWDVIGVVSDVVERRPDAPPGAYAYMPSARTGDSPSVIVRTALEPLALLPLVRAEVARIDPGVAVANPRPLDRAKGVMGAAFAACWLPAWRASRIDPASALRAE